MGLLTNIGSLVTCDLRQGDGALGVIRNGSLAWEGDTITWVGLEDRLPGHLRDQPAIEAHGGMVVPGLIDCHTHLAFGGWRADEFARRLAGESYLDIARTGGGIRRTMLQTRNATEDQLVEHCETNLREMLTLGVTTVECKSGYGLSEEAELKLLRVYRQLGESSLQRIVPTFLGAHIVPPEWADNRGGYIDLLCEELIPRIAEEGLARFCDVFVEETAFTVEEARKILETGSRFGLRPKLHVDQLGDGGGARLAAEVGAISADHLEYTSAEGIAAMAGAGVVGVCLPIASLYLKQKSMPVRDFISSGVPVAVATDFNPGSAPSYDLPLAMMLSCTMNGLTPTEALLGTTRNAARAIGMEERIGALASDMQADFAVLDVRDVNDWMYHFRPNVYRKTFIRGKCLWSSEPEDQGTV